jgi:ParB family chromosome partitioning protein
MSTAERLLERFGANISQSLGVRASGGSPSIRPDEDSPALTGANPTAGRSRARSLGLMDVRNIVPDPDQPRKQFDADALRRLSESLKKFGQLMPIRVRWDQGLGKWLIVSGERRYRAALAAGLQTVTCHFLEESPGLPRVLEEQLVENCLREDLTPVEQARAFRALMEANEWSARRVGEELGLASGTVAKALAILKLPADLLTQVDSGAIPSSVAYELSKLDGENDQRVAAQRVADEKLGRDDAVALVREKSGRSAIGSKKRPKSLGDGATPSIAPAEPTPALSRAVSIVDGRAVLTYEISAGITISISTPRTATSAELASAIAAVVNDLKARLASGDEPTTPWVECAALR